MFLSIIFLAFAQPSALNDPKAFEVLRAWIANQEQHCSVKSGIWKDPAAWGIFLADLARIVAESYSYNSEKEYLIILERIKLAFEIEISETSNASSSNQKRDIE